MKRIKQLLAGAALYAVASAASAFVINGTLDLDPRYPGLDNNFDINVSINAVGDTANWTVTLVSTQPTSFIGEFYFNAGGGPFTFSAFNPGTWHVISPASEVGGGNWGSDGFVYEADNTVNGNNNRVYAGQSLTFTMTKSNGNFAQSDFLNALCSTTTAFSGCWQLGAHIQGVNLGQVNSIFVVGNYDVPSTPRSVPEPGTLALIGASLLGLGALRRRVGA